MTSVSGTVPDSPVAAHAAMVIGRRALYALAIPLSGLAAQTRKASAPEDHLPPNITQVTAFGERPAWSPDGKRLAFIGKSFGDAFEIDLKTKLVRLLTGHFAHTGFLRVQFLPNGDYLLIGARTFRDIRTTRYQDAELWVMKADLSAPPVPLDQKIHEGIAISRTRMRVAWSSSHQQYPEQLAEGESVLYVADVVYDGGTPRLANKQEIIRARGPDCTMEAQDFKRDDTYLVYTCYRDNGEKADVMGVDLRTKAVATYRKVADEYNEAEGVSPDGAYVLVESSHDQGAPERQTFRYIDIWRLSLVGVTPAFTRMTTFGRLRGAEGVESGGESGWEIVRVPGGKK